LLLLTLAKRDLKLLDGSERSPCYNPGLKSKLNWRLRLNWTPSPIPGKYIDHLRLAQLKPVAKAIQDLRLPPIRYRKLKGILNALMMRIEDGGDSLEVNAFLVKALRSVVIHQVGEDAGQAAMQAIEAFQMSEKARWKQIQNGNFPVIQMSPEERFNECFIQL
jgi:hypothetical protein